MTLFRKIYDRVIRWSSHRRAPYYLAGVSFIESSIFPVPPDVMLIPMVLSNPLKAWEYALITTVASILGGIFGYALGFYAFEIIGFPIMNSLGYYEAYLMVVDWFDHYGFLAIVIAGFTPIPYKIFTIAAGAAQMPLFLFIIASLIGRGLRFFMVAGLVRLYGKKLETLFIRYIDIMGWLIILAIVLGVLIYQMV